MRQRLSGSRAHLKPCSHTLRLWSLPQPAQPSCSRPYCDLLKTPTTTTQTLIFSAVASNNGIQVRAGLGHPREKE